MKRSARGDYNRATAQLEKRETAQLEKRSPPDCSRNVRAATTTALVCGTQRLPRRAPTIRQKARLLVPKIMLVWRACWLIAAPLSTALAAALASALSQVRCSRNTTNARTELSKAAQMRMLPTSCRVAGSFFAVAIAVASDATSQRAAVAQKLTNFGRSLRIYRI